MQSSQLCKQFNDPAVVDKNHSSQIVAHIKPIAVPLQVVKYSKLDRYRNKKSYKWVILQRMGRHRKTIQDI